MTGVQTCALPFSDVGYRWNARTGTKALFPVGHGLSYTRFASSDLRTDGATATLTVRNVGDRAGAMVAQLYLVSRDGQPMQRLVGFRRVELAPGAEQTVEMTIDPRLLATWNGDGWTIAKGDYRFAIRSEERRGGKGGVSTGRSWWSADH